VKRKYLFVLAYRNTYKMENPKEEKRSVNEEKSSIGVSER
jgi:hypothetical protein